MLTAKRNVMHKVHEQNDVVFFSPEHDVEDAKANLEAPSHAMHVTHWRDMDSPETITVTVEPGNKL